MPLYVPAAASSSSVSSMSAMFRTVAAADTYLVYGHGSIASIALSAINTEKCFPVYIPEAATATELSIYLRTGQASTTCRLGWRADSAQGPGTLIVDLGTVDTSGASGLKTATGSWSVPAGVSWITATLQGGAAEPSIDGCVNAPMAVGNAQAFHYASWSDVNNYTIAGRLFPDTSGALPTTPDYAEGDQTRDTMVPYFLVKFPI